MAMLWQSIASYPTWGFAPRGIGGAAVPPFGHDVDATTDLLPGALFFEFLLLYGGDAWYAVPT